jgi:hypothetical protein
MKKCSFNKYYYQNSASIVYFSHCKHNNEDGCSTYLRNMESAVVSTGGKDPGKDSTSIISLPQQHVGLYNEYLTHFIPFSSTGFQLNLSLLVIFVCLSFHIHVKHTMKLLLRILVCRVL